MTKAGCILIMIVFIFESIFIIPLIWTVPSFMAISRINNGTAMPNDRILVSVLGIIFGAILGIIGGIFILIDSDESNNH